MNNSNKTTKPIPKEGEREIQKGGKKNEEHVPFKHLHGGDEENNEQTPQEHPHGIDITTSK